MGGCRARRNSAGAMRRSGYGNMAVTSPRLWSCSCRAAPGTPVPLCKALPKRVAPKLEYLQVGRAAHLPYRPATALLNEVLPLDRGISFSGTRQRILRADPQKSPRIE